MDLVKHYASTKTQVLSHEQSGGYKHMYNQSRRQVQVGLWDLLASQSSLPGYLKNQPGHLLRPKT